MTPPAPSGPSLLSSLIQNDLNIAKILRHLKFILTGRISFRHLLHMNRIRSFFRREGSRSFQIRLSHHAGSIRTELHRGAGDRPSVFSLASSQMPMMAAFLASRRRCILPSSSSSFLHGPHQVAAYRGGSLLQKHDRILISICLTSPIILTVFCRHFIIWRTESGSPQTRIVKDLAVLCP